MYIIHTYTYTRLLTKKYDTQTMKLHIELTTKRGTRKYIWKQIPPVNVLIVWHNSKITTFWHYSIVLPGLAKKFSRVRHIIHYIYFFFTVMGPLIVGNCVILSVATQIIYNFTQRTYSGEQLLFYRIVGLVWKVRKSYFYQNSIFLQK